MLKIIISTSIFTDWYRTENKRYEPLTNTSMCVFVCGLAINNVVEGIFEWIFRAVGSSTCVEISKQVHVCSKHTIASPSAHLVLFGFSSLHPGGCDHWMNYVSSQSPRMSGSFIQNSTSFQIKLKLLKFLGNYLNDVRWFESGQLPL